jgi:xylan 1,4-beta-xylosidase
MVVAFRTVVAALLLMTVQTAVATVTVQANLDLSAATTPFPHYWKRCFGSGHTMLGLRSDWQAHMAKAAAEIGVQGLRMHGSMDDDLSITPRKGEYHFYSLDLVYDNMLRHGVKPIVELSFMPAALVSCGGKLPNGTAQKECEWAFGNSKAGVGSYRGLTMPPDDFEDWYDLVKAVAQHMVDRHGLAEVSSWKWEVWNEMWGMDYPHPYLGLYNASAMAIKSVHPSLQVGGPASAGLAYVQEFIEDTKKMNIPVDFVSSHSYPSDGYCSRGTDPDCFVKKILASRAIAQDAGLPYLITEYKDGLQGGPGTSYGGKHGDMAYAAAFIIHTTPMLTDLDAFSWWTISDVFEEGWLSGAPFYGGYGLLTVNGVAKPAYRAFEMLNTAGDQRLPVNISGQEWSPSPDTTPITVFATTHSSGSTAGAMGLQIFASNYWPETGATKDPRPPNVTAVEVTVANLPAKIKTAQLYRIDDNATNPYTTWLAWDKAAQAAGKCNSHCAKGTESKCPCLNYLTPTQIDELNEVSSMKQEEITVGAGGKLSFTLAAYASVNIRFEEY